MARYFFDVQTGDISEADDEGVDLDQASMVSAMAMDLCLQVARERLPGSTNVRVRVRGLEGPTLFECSLSLSGNWVAV
jgi:hypothetical protein